MNKFIQFGTSVLLLFTFGVVKAQSVEYLSAFDMPSGEPNSFQIAGKVDNRYLLYHSNPFVHPQIMYFDESGAFISTHVMDYINPNITTHVNMVCLPDRVNIIAQQLRNRTHYTLVTSINGKGELIGQPHYLDSTSYERYGPGAYYRIVTSADKQYTLLYRIVRGFSNVQVMFEATLLNSRAEKIGFLSFYAPINEDLEQTGNVFLSNRGVAFFPVHDKADNYRIGSTIHLYQVSFNNTPPKHSEIYLKENKPTEIFMDWYEAKQQLVMGGIYYNFYIKRVDGAMTIYLDPGSNVPDTVIYMPLDKEFKKKLRKRVYNLTTADIINSLQMRYFKVSEKGEITLLADMFTNSAYGLKPLMVSTQENQRRSLYSSSLRSQQPQINNNPNRVTTDRPVNSGRRNVNNANYNPAAILQQNVENGLQSEATRVNQPYQLSDATRSGQVMSMTKYLDYKSVIFGVDSSRQFTWKNCVRSLFVPGTAFNNVFIMPLAGTAGIISYEVNKKNMPYLQSHVFSTPGSITTKPVSMPGLPMVFYKRNAVLISPNSFLTLYADYAQNKMGLAIVKW
jgi:hypothetical protein